MSYLLPIVPIGQATIDIECFASYLSRLADAHEVSLHLLLEAVRRWSAKRSLATRIKKGVYGVRINGYSKENLALVSLISEATGMPGLDACTLLALRDVGAGNGISALKREKAWCSACYAQWRKDGVEMYDKLIWQVDGIERCETHRIALSNRCPDCGRGQGGQSLSRWQPFCKACGAFLSHPVRRWIARPTRLPFEHSICEVLQLTVTSPGMSFSIGAPTVFLKAMERAYGYADLKARLGPIAKKPLQWRRFQLRTLSWIAQNYGVSLADLLVDPEGVASQASLDIERYVPPEVHYHRGVSRGTLKSAVASMKAALSAGPPYPTLVSIANSHGCHATYLYANATELTVRFNRLKREYLVSERARKCKIVTRLLNAAKGHSGTERSLHRSIAESTGVSICLVRTIHLELKRRESK
jgi:hypothetical protein